ncbi:MAG: pilus assembly FimT family protein [Actinomycetota bacterium]
MRHVSKKMTGRLRTRRREGGFTIIELMVALFIAGILFAIAVPTIQNYVAIQQLRGRAREVTDVLRTARNLAMDEGVPRYVLFRSGDPPSYQFYRFDPDEGEAGAWVEEGRQIELEGVAFDALTDVTFPALPETPTTGSSVPADAAYFGTRGRYTNGALIGPYTVTLHGGLGKTATLTFYPRTGQVTGV